MKYIIHPDDTRPSHEMADHSPVTLLTFPDAATIWSPYPVKTASTLSEIEQAEALTPLPR